jgi:hypothetical protein
MSAAHAAVISCAFFTVLSFRVSGYTRLSALQSARATGNGCNAHALDCKEAEP